MTKSWADRIHAQPMFEILDNARRMESLGVDVKHLEIGDTEGFDNRVLREHVVARARSERFGYSPSGGEPRLREIVADILARELGRGVDRDEIAIAPANFLILQAMAAVTHTQSQILIPDPGFPTYRLATDFLGLDAKSYDTVHMHLSLDRDSHREWTEDDCPSMVVINNPNNPLGHGAPWMHYQGLVEAARRTRSWLLFDETYANLCYDQSMGDAPGVDEDRCIRIYSVSKEHAVPGLRMGYALAPMDVIDTINRFTSLTVSCLPSFLQLAVADYLESDQSKAFVIELRENMIDRFRYLEECFDANGLSSSLIIRPNAGFYAMIRTPGEVTAAETMLVADGIATCPGAGFGLNSTESVRISLAGRLDAVREGIDRLADVLARQPYSNFREESRS
jgi:aspartate/methionine/tyrosine aminotransferase